MTGPLTPITRADRDILTRQLRMNFNVTRTLVEFVEQLRIADFVESLTSEHPSDRPEGELVVTETIGLAKYRFKADAAMTKGKLDELEAQAHAELVRPFLSGERARQLLAEMPSIERLMQITVAEMEPWAQREEGQ